MAFPQNDFTSRMAGNVPSIEAELPLKEVNGKLTNNGNLLTVTGNNAWAEGERTSATAGRAHAEGYMTEASAADAHAEGSNTIASGVQSHAEGAGCIASGKASHAGGLSTRMSAQGGTSIGRFNSDGTALFVVGNGTSNDDRKDVFKVDSNGDTWVMINGVLTQITSIGGGSGTTIYGTLQNAIADAANLSVGDYFETNGFHTSGDGGAARYVVSSSGTANGMDIVQLATGKLAVLQINQNREMYPEQFGYDRFASQNLTPVLERMVSQNVRNIRLLPCGSDNFPYLMTTGWTVNVPSVSIVGYSGLTTGYASRIWFKPDAYDANVTSMFSLTQRDFIMKNIVIMNRPWFTEGDKHNCVAIYMAITNTNKMWYDFDNLAIQGFDIGIGKLIPSGGTVDGLMWHCEFHKLQMALNNKNIYLKGLSYVTKFDNCFFTVNDSGAQSVVVEESFTVEFDRCNFGIYSPADTVLKFNKFVVADAPVDERWTSAKFTNCNFEIESNDSHPLPNANSGYFAKFDNDDDFHIEFDNCFFISTPLARANIYGCRAFSLGDHTTVKFSNCCGSYADVKYTGNEFYEWDFQKRMFDGTRPPKKEIGSVIIQHSMGIITPPNNQWGSIYLPTVKTDEMTCPQCDNDTDFLLNYPTAKDGLMLMNLDDASVRTKMGNSLVQVVSPQSGKIRIGDRVYDYVAIDGRKWITTNLQLWTMNSRQWRFPDHPEFGFYYKTDAFAEIDALLPSGWRRPNYADCQSLIGQGYAAIQGLGWPVWSSATNSSGFNAMPCGRWREPDITPDFSMAFLWGPEENGVGWHNIWIRSTQLTYGGWAYAEAANLKCALRVCCDA